MSRGKAMSQEPDEQSSTDDARAQERAEAASAADRGNGEDAADAAIENAPSLREEIERLRVQVQELQEQAEHNLQGWQRAQADVANLRRRTEQERAEQVKFAALRLIVDLLPVLDDFDRFWQALPEETSHSAWVEGVRLIDQKLRGELATHGLSPLEAQGKPFDPYLHEAVLREEGEPSELTTVVQELQRGYRLHDRVVRPSMVKVGKGPRAESSDQDQEGG